MRAKAFAGGAFNWKPNNGIGAERRRLNPSKTPIRTITFAFSTTTSNQESWIRPRRRGEKNLVEPSPGKLTISSGHVVCKKRGAKALIQRLSEQGLTPSQLLDDDGDWSKEELWAVIDFLKRSSRLELIPEVFEAWTNLDRSRANEWNYTRIIELLSEVGLVEEAVLALQEMKSHSLKPTMSTYNSIIHGYANKGQFEDALIYLDGMEQAGLRPDGMTYDGLMEAYGKFHNYDGMMNCLKMMKRHQCLPDHVTYNLLIREFARGGLLNRMEKYNQLLLSKKMPLQASTLTAMIEAYISFGLVEKMESLYQKETTRSSKKSVPSEELIRKIARMYIKNYMFSRLDDLGRDLFARMGTKKLVWCLKLLSHACSLSKKGMNSVLEEMGDANIPWNATVVNILLLGYLKMQDLKLFKNTLVQLPGRDVVPDIVTFSILYDANTIGLDWCWMLRTWEIYGYLDRCIEMKTDPLVLVAFGRGQFLTTIEEMYSSLKPEAREKKWTYRSLINYVLEHKRAD